MIHLSTSLIYLLFNMFHLIFHITPLTHPHIIRTDVLGQYLSLSAQYSRLTEAIPAMLHHFVPFPQNVPADPNVLNLSMFVCGGRMLNIYFVVLGHLYFELVKWFIDSYLVF
jgi:hypothetical protein